MASPRDPGAPRVSRHVRQAASADSDALLHGILAGVGLLVLLTSVFWMPWFAGGIFRETTAKASVAIISIVLAVPYVWWQYVRIYRNWRLTVQSVSLYPDRMVCRLQKGKMDIPWKKISRIFQSKVEQFVNGLYTGLFVNVSVELESGERLKFDNSLDDISDFATNLANLSRDALVAKSRKRLERGETLDFGGSLKLSDSEVRVGFTRFPADRIVNFGIQNIHLVIDAGELGSEKVEFQRVANLAVLQVLLEDLTGKPALSETPPPTSQESRSKQTTDWSDDAEPIGAVGRASTRKDLDRWLDEQEPYKTFGPNLSPFFVKQAAGWLLIFIGLVPLIGINYQVQIAKTSPPMTYLIGVLLFPLFGIPGGLYVFFGFRGLSAKAYCFDQGFVCVVAGDMKGCRWDEIASMAKRNVREKVKTNTAGFWQFIKGVQGKNEILDIERYEGKPIPLNAYTVSNGFVAELEQRTLPHLLPRAKAALRQGHPLHYDDFTLDERGVKCLGQGNLSWPDIHGAVLEYDQVRVMSKDGAKTMKLGECHFIGNIHLLVALINERADGKASRSPASGSSPPWPNMIADLWITLAIAAVLAGIVVWLFTAFPVLWLLGVAYGVILVLLALAFVEAVIKESRRRAAENIDGSGLTILNGLVPVALYLAMGVGIGLWAWF